MYKEVMNGLMGLSIMFLLYITCSVIIEP